jgi:hypothetical protein
MFIAKTKAGNGTNEDFVVRYWESGEQITGDTPEEAIKNAAEEISTWPDYALWLEFWTQHLFAVSA